MVPSYVNCTGGSLSSTSMPQTGQSAIGDTSSQGFSLVPGKSFPSRRTGFLCLRTPRSSDSIPTGAPRRTLPIIRRTTHLFVRPGFSHWDGSDRTMTVTPALGVRSDRPSHRPRPRPRLLRHLETGGFEFDGPTRQPFFVLSWFSHPVTGHSSWV